MFERLLHVIGSPLARLWLRNSRASWRLLPTPESRTVSHSTGPNVDRILLVGSGIAVGYGVRTGDLALGGQLSRKVPGLTSRGASVETVTRSTMRVSGCAAILAGLDLTRYDALILALGTDEALNLVVASKFAERLESLFAWLDVHSPAGLAVLFVGIPDIPTIMDVPRAVSGAISHQCRILNNELKLACGTHALITYAPFRPPRADLLKEGDRHLYAIWAEILAPAVARVLDAQVEQPRKPSTIDEDARQRALDVLNILDSAPREQFDRIVNSARDLFGVAGASITFIDRQRQWTMASNGIDRIDSPRFSALGDATVNNGKMLVVPDASRDPHFSGHPWVVGRSQVRFFAGFPIEAADGQRIGALCLVDPTPRQFSVEEGSLLGRLALQVETELWGRQAKRGWLRRR